MTSWILSARMLTQSLLLTPEYRCVRMAGLSDDRALHHASQTRRASSDHAMFMQCLHICSTIRAISVISSCASGSFRGSWDRTFLSACSHAASACRRRGRGWKPSDTLHAIAGTQQGIYNDRASCQTTVDTQTPAATPDQLSQVLQTQPRLFESQFSAASCST
jgi:hypothetical protein